MASILSSGPALPERHRQTLARDVRSRRRRTRSLAGAPVSPAWATWRHFNDVGSPSELSRDRSGQIWNYVTLQYLSQHPDIYMSPVKEPNFFVAEGNAVPYEGPHGPVMEWVTTFDDYVALFRKVSTERAIGEASVLYLYSPRAAARICQRIPEARPIVLSEIQSSARTPPIRPCVSSRGSRTPAFPTRWPPRTSV